MPSDIHRSCTITPANAQASDTKLALHDCLLTAHAVTVLARIFSPHARAPIRSCPLVTAQYAARVAAGKIERDPAQQAIVDRLARARAAARRASPGAQIVVARLAVRRARAQRGADQGPLHLRRGRPRQDHADGPVLRGVAGRCASAACISTNSWPTCTSASTRCARSSKPARSATSDPIALAAAAIARRGLAALLRRIPRHRHRRCHDSRPAVHSACSSAASWWSRPRTCAPDELYKDGLNRALFLPFIALIEAAHGRGAARRAHRFPAGKARRRSRSGTCPATKRRDARSTTAWRRLTGGHAGRAAELAVKGAHLHVPRAAMGVARFSFHDLCEQPLARRRLSHDRARISHHRARPYPGDGSTSAATRPSASSF